MSTLGEYFPVIKTSMGYFEGKAGKGCEWDVFPRCSAVLPCTFVMGP